MKHLSWVLFLVISLSACSKSETNKCEYNPCAIVAPSAEISALESSLVANSVTATKHCSGLFYILDAAGSGSSPDICSTVNVKYKGQLTTNGAVFDEATSPVSFPVNNLIEGWKKGLLLLKPGAKIRMWIPPSLAYGAQDVRDGSGNLVIPANTPLYFEIELVSIN